MLYLSLFLIFWSVVCLSTLCTILKKSFLKMRTFFYNIRYFYHQCVAATEVKFFSKGDDEFDWSCEKHHNTFSSSLYLLRETDLLLLLVAKSRLLRHFQMFTANYQPLWDFRTHIHSDLQESTRYCSETQTVLRWNLIASILPCVYRQLNSPILLYNLG